MLKSKSFFEVFIAIILGVTGTVSMAQQHELTSRDDQTDSQHAMDGSTVEHGHPMESKGGYVMLSNHTSSKSLHAVEERTLETERLVALKVVPPSGTSREAGFDNRYAMESTAMSKGAVGECAPVYCIN